MVSYNYFILENDRRISYGPAKNTEYSHSEIIGIHRSTMQPANIVKNRFLLESEGLNLQVFTASPTTGEPPYPSVQIHHGGGGYEDIYTHMTEDLARHGFTGISMIHRGYPGSEGRQEYGQGEIMDIGNLVCELKSDSRIDTGRMGIMGYSRGAHNALLATERYDCFRAAALWSVPVDMVDHVQVNPWVAEIIGGTARECPQVYRRLSAIHFVDQIDCPLLLIHGENDDVIPVRHSLRLADAMKKRGKPVELRCHAHEGHIWTPHAFYENWQQTLHFFERVLL